LSPRIVIALAVIVVSAVLLNVGGCKKGSQLSYGGTFTPAAAPSDEARTTSSITGPGGEEFTFQPLDGDGSDDPKGGDAYKLALHEGKDGNLVLDISTNEDGEWKYVLGYVYYDPDKYNPVGFEKGEMFKDDDKDLLILPVYSEKGKFAFWLGLGNFDEKEPKGQGQICSIEFEQSLWEPPKEPLTAPDDEADKVDDLQTLALNDLQKISWSERNVGDGDISGEVSISDGTPLALHHTKFTQYDVAPHGEPVYRELDQVDYDANGRIWMDSQIHDDPPRTYQWDPPAITLNYLESVARYHIKIYRDPQRTQLLLEDNIPGPSYSMRQSIRNLSCDWNVGLLETDISDPCDFPSGTNGLLNYSHTPEGRVGYRYWHTLFDQMGERIIVYAQVQPFDAEGNPGIASDWYPVAINYNMPPVVSFTVTPMIGTIPFTVQIDGSATYDPDGPENDLIFKWYPYHQGENPIVEPGPVFEHTYSGSPGEYHPELFVVDPSPYPVVGTNWLQEPIVGRDALNDAGFAEENAKAWYVGSLTGTRKWIYTLKVDFRQTARGVQHVPSLKMRFFGDGDPETDDLSLVNWNSLRIRVWDNDDRGTPGPWALEFEEDPGTRSGLLDPVGEAVGVEFPEIGLVTRSYGFLSRPNDPTLCEAWIIYFPAPPEEYEAPVHSTGTVCELRFSTIEADHNPAKIGISLLYDGNSQYTSAAGWPSNLFAPIHDERFSDIFATAYCIADGTEAPEGE
jgi:hypothetical protein